MSAVICAQAIIRPSTPCPRAALSREMRYSPKFRRDFARYTRFDEVLIGFVTAYIQRWSQDRAVLMSASIVGGWEVLDARRTTLPPAACANLAAAVDAYWFNGHSDRPLTGPLAPAVRESVRAKPQGYPASNQQDGERVFLADIFPRLCARPDQSDDQFTAIVHSMLDEVCAPARAPCAASRKSRSSWCTMCSPSQVRKHIARHTHGAFWGPPPQQLKLPRA